MTNITAGDLATDFNTRWQAGSYPKPVDGRGGTGFTSSIYDNRQNSIWRVKPPIGADGAQIRQIFKIFLVHPTEAAIDYCVTIIQASTLAGTMVIADAESWTDGTNYYCIFELVTIQ